MLSERTNCRIKVSNLANTVEPSGAKTIAKELGQNASVEEVDLGCDFSCCDENDDMDDDGGGARQPDDVWFLVT